MKKSTYIIIGFLGVLALLAFILPPIYFRKNYNSEVTISDSYTKSELPSFSAIDIKSTFIAYGDMPIVLIKGVADGEKAGVLELNQTWADNSTFVVEDDILTINLNLYGMDGPRVKYHGESKPVVIVYVDSTLMNLTCRDALLMAENLNGSDISLNGHFDMTVNNSKINSLVFRNRKYGYDSICLTLNDTSSVNWLTVRDYEVQLVTNDSAFVDTIVLAPEEYGKIDLGTSMFKAVINSAENGGTSCVTLDAPATLKRD